MIQDTGSYQSGHMNLVSEKRTIPEIRKKERCFSGVFFSLLTSCSDDVQNKEMCLMQKAQ